MLGHSFVSRNIPLRSIYSLVRMRARKEEIARAPHRNFGHMLASLARRLHMNVMRHGAVRQGSQIFTKENTVRRLPKLATRYPGIPQGMLLLGILLSLLVSCTTSPYVAVPTGTPESELATVSWDGAIIVKNISGGKGYKAFSGSEAANPLFVVAGRVNMSMRYWDGQRMSVNDVPLSFDIKPGDKAHIRANVMGYGWRPEVLLLSKRD